MKSRIILSVLLFFFFVSSGFAEMQIYLYSTAQMGAEELRVKDIALVDGPEDECKPVREIVINDALLTDTYVDRRELSLFLRKHNIRGFTIYGSSVKVFPFTDENVASKTPAIKSGDKVKVIVKKKNITLELTGSALKDAEIGSEAVVRCGGSQISGIVKDSKTVTCEI